MLTFLNFLRTYKHRLFVYLHQVSRAVSKVQVQSKGILQNFSFKINSSIQKSSVQLTLPVFVTFFVVIFFQRIFSQLVKTEVGNFENKPRVDDAIRRLQLPVRMD